MSKKQKEPHPLRAEAEKQLAHALLTGVPARSAEELLHELRVHQIELEMRNEELRRAQVALEESRDRYADLYEFAPDGYLTLTREGMIDEVNLTGAVLLGVERKKLLGCHFADFIISEDSEHWHRHFLNVLQHGGHQSCELTLQRGRDSLFHARLDCLCKESDNASSVRIALADNTRLRQGEDALREWQQFVDYAAWGMTIGDMESLTIRLANPAYARMHGYTVEELQGMQVDCMHTLESRASIAHYTECLRASGRYTFECVRLRKDGSTFPAVVDVSIVKDVDGRGNFIASVKDITERKREEQQMRELSAHLQTVREEEKTSFAREIHDDLGSTLTALKMDASWLARKLPLEAEMLPLRECAKSMIDLLDNAVIALRRIITDLRPTMLDDLGLLATLKWQAAQFHKRTGTECKVVCAGDESCECKLDQTVSINMFRIFQESLTNVARHSGASRVEVEFQHGNEEVILSISDNGCGLPEGHAVASTSYGIRGMRERVEHLGGKIKFDSQPGSGFSVTVRLPLPVTSQEEVALSVTH
jgi:PAS domain S-box-containing protein